MDPAVDSLLSVSDCDSAIADSAIPQDEARIIQIKRRRNSLLPISRLHRELFHHILELALFDVQVRSDDPTPRSRPSHYTDLFALRWVSHGWEHEIVNTPRLWTPISPLRNTSFQNLIWERSGAAALEVAVSRFPTSNDGFWYKAEKTFLARVMTREIRELYAMVPERADLDSYIAGRRPPRIKVLSLRGAYTYVCTKPLRILQLEELNIDRCNIIWGRLQNLRILSVKESNGPNLAQLISILQSSPRLERLSLDTVNAFSDRAEVPLNPIYLPQLSILEINFVADELVSGLLERLFTSDACRVTSISWMSSEWSSSSGFLHQAGRICTPQRPGEQIIEPRVILTGSRWHLETTSRRYLNFSISNDQKTTTGWLTEAARMFFAPSKELPFTARSCRFRLELDFMLHVAEGLEIVHENFPETVELKVHCKEGLEGLAVLAKPKVEEGKPVWLLPKLAVLKLGTQDRAFDYGGIIAMAIERTQAATSSPSALSPINSLTLGKGRVHIELLGRLEEVGIKCEQNGVTVVV